MLDMAKDTQYPVRKLAYFSEEMAAAIADYRFANRIPSENETIRRLISIGLAATPLLSEQLGHLERDPLANQEVISSIERALGLRD